MHDTTIPETGILNPEKIVREIITRKKIMREINTRKKIVCEIVKSSGEN